MSIQNKIRKFTKAAIVPVLFSLLLAIQSMAFPIRVGVGPDNNHQLLLGALASAKKNILINIYEFKNAQIAYAIIQQIQKGVTVSMLVEGDPLHQPISTDGMKVIHSIRSVMLQSNNPNHRIFIMTEGPNKRPRRFVYDHAKYVVIDGRRVIISSENFSDTGHALPGTIGNRGWEVVMENPEIASQLTQMFISDANAQHGDVLTFDIMNPRYGLPANSPPSRRTLPSIPSVAGKALSYQLITSPNSLPGIINLIRSARSHLELEFMSLPDQWKDANPNGQSPIPRIQNPIVFELIQAARRGVKVRVILDDGIFFNNSPKPLPPEDPAQLPDYLFARQNYLNSPPPSPTAQQETVLYLQQVAAQEKIPLFAQIANTQKMQVSYIHNKGILVDGIYSFVSSINGTQNSVINNRELGIQLESPDATKYFENVFNFDWNASVKWVRPILPKKTGPRPLHFFSFTNLEAFSE